MASVEELCDHIALIDRSKKILEGSVNGIKSAYKSNTFEIAFIGNSNDLNALLGSHYEVIKNHTEEERSVATIKILNGKTQNDLLSVLIPNVTIISFKEILPTMNDIFINKVNKNKQP
jgi:ABC-2 type transport system ATP-binding protein